MEPKSIHKILFVCTGNICRSTLAEYMLRKRLESEPKLKIDVKSAGVAAMTDDTSPQEILDILKKLDIDGSVHRSQPLTRDLVNWADVILVMESGHQMMTAQQFPRAVGKVHLFKTFVKAEGKREIADPMGQKQKVYEACAEDISKAVEKLLIKIKELEKGSTEEKP